MGSIEVLCVKCKETVYRKCLARVTLFHTGKKPQGQAFNHVMDMKISLQKEGWKDARAAYRK
ncbi:hypothetical protein JCM37173_08030 [Allocoprococcus similis]